MKPRRFREHAHAGETLAIDPTALTIMFGSAPNTAVDVTDEGVAVFPIEGPLEHKAGSWCDSYEAIVERFEEACADDEVRAIVLRIDSPGGETDGLLEAVRAMQSAKEASGKPVIAFADECAASAAYALACAADEIYLPPSGGVGSIGVIATLLEMTARDEMEGLHFELIASGLRKADGNPHVEITDGARKRTTSRVQQLAGMFFELVAETRGLSTEDVDALEADVFYGDAAVDAGIADGVMSWSEVLSYAADGVHNTGSGEPVSGSTGRAPRAQGDRMNQIESLTKKKLAAKTALAKATSEKAKREAGTSYRKACVALALAEASLEARKMKKTKYVEETLDDSSEGEAEDDAEDEGAEDDAEDADAEDAEDDADAKKKTTITHEDDEGDDDDDEDDEGDDDGDAKKMKRASFTGVSLEATIAKLTGKKSRSAMIGAIEGAFRAAEQARKDVAQLKSERKAEKIERILSDAKEAGKVTRGELPSLRQAAETNGIGWLKANLEQRPALVRREELMPKPFEGLEGKVDADAAQVFAKMGLTKEQAEKASALLNQQRRGTNGVVR